MSTSEAFIYDSAATKSPAISEIGELIRYRDLLRLLIGKIIKTRYKRSSLGVAWTVLNPVLNMVVMAVAFSTVFKDSVSNYPVYLLVGLIWWNFLTQTTNYAIGSVVWGGAILKRVYLPRTIYAIASIAHGLINLAITLVPLAVIMLAMGHPFHATWWFVPIAVLMLAVFALGVALFVSTLAVFFGDVIDLYGLLLQAWFFLTPIVYPESIFPPQFAWFLRMNPLRHLLEMFRAPILLGTLPEASMIAASAGWALGAFLLGWFTFTYKANEFAYRL